MDVCTEAAQVLLVVRLPQGEHAAQAIGRVDLELIGKACRTVERSWSSTERRTVPRVERVSSQESDIA